MTAFTRQPVHQPPRIFMSEARPFAATVADYCPCVVSQIAHKPKGAGRLPALLTFEFCLTFFEEGPHAFVLVLTREAKREQINFTAQAFVHI